MAAGSVRKLRVSSSTNVATGVDLITNPQRLAHQLLRLDSLVEENRYMRRLRLSNIADVCVREQLLGLRNDVIFKGVVDISLRVTFDLGSGIHDFLQNGANYLGENRLGWWRCSACGRKIFGRRPTAHCHKCTALPGAFRYQEHALRLPEGIPVSGHPDNFLEVAPGDIRIVDFKSINGEEFERLTAPKAEHAMQVNGYMEYIQYDDTLPVRIHRNKGFVLYVSKKHMPKSLPFKMFHVERNPAFIQVIHSKVADFTKGLEDESFLPAPSTKCLAAHFQSGRARTCPVVALCSQLCT